MDSIICEESSFGESSLFNHRAIYMAQQHNTQSICNQQPPIYSDHQPKVSGMKLTSATKKKQNEPELKIASNNQKTQMNAKLNSLLNFSKKLEEMRPDMSKPKSAKGSKFSLNFSLKPNSLNLNKTNTSFAFKDHVVKRHPSIMTSISKTDTLSTRMTPSSSTTPFNEIPTPAIHKIVISSKEKMLQLNYAVGQKHNTTQDYKLLSNFKTSIEDLSKFMPNTRYPFAFNGIFQTYQNKDHSHTAIIDSNKLENYDQKSFTKWREELKKRTEYTRKQSVRG